MGWKILRIHDHLKPYTVRGETRYGVYEWTVRRDGESPPDSDISADAKSLRNELNNKLVTTPWSDAGIGETVEYPGVAWAQDEKWCVVRGPKAYQLDAADNPPELAGIVAVLKRHRENVRLDQESLAKVKARAVAEQAERDKAIMSVASALNLSEDATRRLVSDLRRLIR